MKNKVAVLVPSTIYNQPAEFEVIDGMIDVVERSLSDWFGGCSTIEVRGCYKANSGELIREKVYRVESFCETSPAESIDAVKALANRVKDALSQESVAYEINGELLFQ
jgi:hypothetical protein